MINFGIPSTLKSYIDHILRPGATFRYVPQEFRAQSTLDLCATVEISQPCDYWISRFIEISCAIRCAPWG